MHTLYTRLIKLLSLVWSRCPRVRCNTCAIIFSLGPDDVKYCWKGMGDKGMSVGGEEGGGWVVREGVNFFASSSRSMYLIMLLVVYNK